MKKPCSEGSTRSRNRFNHWATKNMTAVILTKSLAKDSQVLPNKLNLVECKNMSWEGECSRLGWLLNIVLRGYEGVKWFMLFALCHTCDYLSCHLPVSSLFLGGFTMWHSHLFLSVGHGWCQFGWVLVLQLIIIIKKKSAAQLLRSNFVADFFKTCTRSDHFTALILIKV